MKHIVTFSTGVASAEVLFRLVERYGAENVVAVTADTRMEDGDNWRFAHEVLNRLAPVEWVYQCDGRTPMQVGRDKRCVPNNWMPVCSLELKIKMMRDWLELLYKPDECVLALGLDWTEEHRIEGREVNGKWVPGTRERWQPYETEYPLLTDRPLLTKYQLLDHMRDVRGIEPPALYATGAPHANCGGGCVRAGQSEWSRLLWWNRGRYLEWEAEEEETRALLGKDVSILKDRRDKTTVPLSLRSFRERLEEDASLFDREDVGPCACI